MMSSMMPTLPWTLRQIGQVSRLWTEAKIDAAYIYVDREGVIEATQRKLADALKYEAHVYAVEIDLEDVQFAHEDVEMPPGIRIRAYWQPATHEVEFIGGANDGRTATVQRIGEPYRLPLPPSWSLADYEASADPTVSLPLQVYELSGWSGMNRRWIYSLT